MKIDRQRIILLILLAILLVLVGYAFVSYFREQRFDRELIILSNEIITLKNSAYMAPEKLNGDFAGYGLVLVVGENSKYFTYEDKDGDCRFSENKDLLISEHYLPDYMEFIRTSMGNDICFRQQYAVNEICLIDRGCSQNMEGNLDISVYNKKNKTSQSLRIKKDVGWVHVK